MPSGLHYDCYSRKVHGILLARVPFSIAEDLRKDVYFFVAVYAVMLFFLCALFFPEEMADDEGFKDYFCSRRQWIFCLLTVVFVFDLADTFVKGWDYFHTLGAFYSARTALYISRSASAIKIENEKFHAAFAPLAVFCEIALIFRSCLTVT